MKNERDTVVGIFLDQEHAQSAIQQLKSAGFQVQQSKGSGNDFQGLSKDERGLYESRAKEGNTFVVVRNAADRGEEALNIMLGAGAENVDMNAQQGQSQGQGQAYSGQRDANYYNSLSQRSANERRYGQNAQNADDIRLHLREEQLTATKQARQAGEVQVHKTVHEEQQQIPVNLRHEEVTIERHAVDRPVSGEIGDLQDETIRVPVYEEQAQLQKQGRVTEEVIINKDVVEQQQTLQGTVRREDVELNQSGNVVRDGEDRTAYQGPDDNNTYNQR